jgi:hypothetical protein
MRAICSTRLLWLVGLATILGGCDKLFGLSRVSDDTALDAPSDLATIDAPCLGQGILTALCLESPQPTINLTSAIDTSSDPRCRKVPQDSGPELCVLDAHDIVVSELVMVTGTRPLVLLAENSVEITSVLDASSRRGMRTGAGAQMCASGNGANGLNGAGGGGGGSFGFSGGAGGSGQSGAMFPASGGMPSTVSPQTAVYGGCAGGAGGIGGTSGVGAASAGDGGGAIYVIAGTQIHVAAGASINASGAAGGGALAKLNGGGGAGSGGFIALDAPMIIIDGELFARGGGGGGGGGTSAASSPGTEAIGAGGAVPGGAAASGGSRGGDGCGAPGGTVGGFASSAPAGGGGGGGACGRIRLYGMRAGGGLINPAPT